MTLTITQRQVHLLADVRSPLLTARLVAHLRRFFPVDVELLGEAGARAVADLALARARHHRLESFGETCRYLNLMLGLGAWFDQDPLLPWARAALALPGPSADRMAALDADAMPWFEATAGTEGRTAVKALLRARTLTPASLTELRLGPASPPDPPPLPDPAAPPPPSPPPADPRDLLRRLLVDLHPEKARAAGLPALEASLDRAALEAEQAGLDTPHGTPLWAVLAFILGAGFARDPLVPWAAAALATAGDAAARATALHAAALDAIDAALTAMRLPDQA